VFQCMFKHHVPLECCLLLCLVWVLEVGLYYYCVCVCTLSHTDFRLSVAGSYWIAGLHSSVVALHPTVEARLRGRLGRTPSLWACIRSLLSDLPYWPKFSKL
jgi:hypothetical protein